MRDHPAPHAPKKKPAPCGAGCGEKKADVSVVAAQTISDGFQPLR